MTKHYTVHLEDGTQIGFRARKDAAVKLGHLQDEAFRVLSPSGQETYSWKPEKAEETVPEPKPKKPVDLEKMKAKIAMLLAKAESTTFPEERDTFNAAAEKLMVRLGIARAELEGLGQRKPDPIVEVTREFKGNYSISFIPFVNLLAQGFGHLTVLQRKSNVSLSRWAYIIGTKTDVEDFVTLLDSLHVQCLAGLRVWQKEHIEERRYLTDMEKYIQHRSFIEGFGSTVSTRLAATRQQEEETVSSGTALVLASKESRIQEWMDQNYPTLGKARGGSRSFSSEGYRGGQKAGESANIGLGQVSSQTKVSGLLS